jgi:hypothetical protein
MVTQGWQGRKRSWRRGGSIQMRKGALRCVAQPPPPYKRGVGVARCGGTGGVRLGRGERSYQLPQLQLQLLVLEVVLLLAVMLLLKSPSYYCRCQLAAAVAVSCGAAAGCWVLEVSLGQNCERGPGCACGAPAARLAVAARPPPAAVPPARQAPAPPRPSPAPCSSIRQAEAQSLQKPRSLPPATRCNRGWGRPAVRSMQGAAPTTQHSTAQRSSPPTV